MISDSCNWITSSVSNSTTPSNLVICQVLIKQGYLGSPDIDIISSGTLSGSDSNTQGINLWTSQVFSTGEEDLYVDVTSVVSATMAGLIPDHGFRISFSGSQETDKATRFVKRFSINTGTEISSLKGLL